MDRFLIIFIFLATAASHPAAVHFLRKGREVSADRAEKFNSMIEEYGRNQIIQQMDTYIQHGETTTLEHCRNVAWMSYIINRNLRLNSDEESLVRGAMMHDMFLYDWHDGKPERKRHGFDHPGIACRNAVEYFGISEKEQSIIMSHMWPLNIRYLPRCREAAIVCFADKYCAVLETLKISGNFAFRTVKGCRSTGEAGI